VLKCWEGEGDWDQGQGVGVGRYGDDVVGLEGKEKDVGE
jgi:hypothetical protein